MPAHLAKTEMTTEERQEFLLGVIACAVTGTKPAQLFPWIKRGLDEFFQEVGRG
jgi:hypothetical protein